jgi:GT2 family glycosyltransferase
MSEKKFAVVILNWNGQPLLERFLPSVVAHSPEAHIYVIDNASTDNSREWLAAAYPGVGCIALGHNGGYAGGYNAGLQNLKEPYWVLLNSDVAVSEGWLKPLARRLEADAQLAALQPKLRALRQPTYFEYAGAAGGYLDALGYPFCRGRLFDELEPDHGQYDDFQHCFWASGACLVVRAEAFRQVGGLYEALFAHMEEIDLCWRLQQRGYRVACEPASVVYHLGGATLQESSPQKTYLNFRNSLIISFLNFSPGRHLRVVGQRLLLDGLAGFLFLARRQPRHVSAILRAHFHFYSRLPQLLKERRRRRAQVSQEQLKGLAPFRVVAQFYLRRRRRFAQLPRI